ncbi:bifunctional 5,10-methylene-tetrahydrofolate dehydrogenase/5,10-methylene-tetrahydrofolate cyclohydrolase [Treponema phagedenis]|uniref:Bifunctional protein FolD n=1 Tax=Treponema phagedenis TaxID=162 RepID=A0A0B7GUD2_TREPH|nr:tetrahydrofolate dehydrogenase/cyclohydrolase catalytic domain-containing protein [Treponema phagedenis]QEJ93881.1 bifunctional 5,10-methylene-tetrahydrofolate dehydrogenase/5,10-methylene-tetrahydrofolate cyclohydrolase [Treponema phagedenis]QEJ99403.1 bifunctional 5,10-methylene-tetrahydrofolate dehydrogenase/5,10-methylene-tetrahydrofolate cyclohydrolase [Treponema phagedenis]QEJ99805.1 bifunctional 5,10-methylene-tetrahydrofolate dehydrogenase/5,10-methylene-tetrahydrofolate cyclohydrolas
MGTKIIDGFSYAAELRTELKNKVSELKAQGITPALATILVGNDPASLSYISSRHKVFQETGMADKLYTLSATATEEELLSLIYSLNDDAAIHGILVQFPLPSQMRRETIIQAIKPDKDVDGFHPLNCGKLFLGYPVYIPCTAHGVLYLLEKEEIKTEGAQVVILGRTGFVGKPLSALLSEKPYNATVTLCHSKTRDLPKLCLQADILITAIGKPHYITADMVKEGAVVIDIGINRVPAENAKGYKITGDVDFENVAPKTSAITPVPRGVGPMTVTMLLSNTLQAACRQHGLSE